MNLLAPIFLTSCLALSSISAQTPQFTVVKPNGITSVYSSWNSAYTAASNDDYIYLPGVTINSSMTIDKRIHIYGAGFHPDSSIASGKTTVNSPVIIKSGANGGSLTGVQINNSVTLGEVRKVQYFTLKRCNILTISFYTYNNDSIPEYCTITESITSTITSSNTGSGGYISKNHLFSKNIITSQISLINQSTFTNNIFTSTVNPIYSNISNSTIQNNIFLTGYPVYAANNCYNSYFNNLSLIPGSYTSNCSSNSDSGNITVTNISEIFVSYDNNGFAFTNDYHLQATCPGEGAGSDGTDVGIFGTNNPTPEGWLPSNPHIFFKQIDSETGSDGKFHIQVGVRANNN